MIYLAATLRPDDRMSFGHRGLDQLFRMTAQCRARAVGRYYPRERLLWVYFTRQPTEAIPRFTRLADLTDRGFYNMQLNDAAVNGWLRTMIALRSRRLPERFTLALTYDPDLAMCLREDALEGRRVHGDYGAGYKEIFSWIVGRLDHYDGYPDITICADVSVPAPTELPCYA